ncbi:MAG: hypothetical protein P4L51_18385 [Puia sp.]|nr:hypothetical protein [Puia sp.]
MVFYERPAHHAVHGIRNKGQAISARDLDTAQERMGDWQERFGT